MDKQAIKGIWIYQALMPKVDLEYRLTLGEGDTPLININHIFFKYEFENPTGSIKDRSMAYQISKLLELNIKSAAISSSGNAAISAANYCSLAGIKLTVFVSPKINTNKLKQLKKLDCKIVVSDKPISRAFVHANKHHAYNLRQSKDPNALYGSMTLAYELVSKQPKIDAIFIPISSGTNLVGIAQGYQKLNRKPPAIHAVQTEAVCPVASIFDKNYQKKSVSIADAIVAKYTTREARILELIKTSKGSGWVISDTDILTADKWLKQRKIICSYEGAATLAALWKAVKAGFSYKYPVCILTGKYYERK